jgi:hypothetical protein
MDSFSTSEFQRLTGLDDKVIDRQLATLSAEPSIEELVAAFVGCKLPGRKPVAPAEEKFSILALSKLCNLDRATVTDRLEGIPSHPGPKNAKLYSLADALPALIAGRDVNLDQVKLKRETHREKREEIELNKTILKLVDVTEVRTELQEIFKALHRRLAINFWRENASRLKKAKTVAELVKLGQDGQGKIFDALRANYKLISGSD